MAAGEDWIGSLVVLNGAQSVTSVVPLQPIRYQGHNYKDGYELGAFKDLRVQTRRDSHAFRRHCR